MKVLFLTDWHARGGAAIAANRLAGALSQQGHEVVWAAARVEAHGPNVYSYADGPFVRQAAQRLANKFVPTFEPVIKQTFMVRRIHEIVRQVRPHVINVHNIHGANLPPPLPAELSRHTPVVWTLHDMWAFTGTCVYSYDCRAFVEGCTAACPHCERYPCLPASQVSAAYRSRRRALQRAGRIAMVCPSRWLAQEARAGMFRDQCVRVIPNSLDLETFYPIGRSAARTALGVPDDAPVILSASLALNDPRKGAASLLQAISRLTARKITWLTLGQNDQVAVPDHVRHLPMPSVQDERLLRLAYNAADVHVLPTMADNLPNVLLEAASCGTPSVAFGVGGVGEVVIDGTTGWNVTPGDTSQLVTAIERVLQLDANRTATLRRSCRVFAEKHFAPSVQSSRYTELFTQLIASGHQRKAA